MLKFAQLNRFDSLGSPRLSSSPRLVDSARGFIVNLAYLLISDSIARNWAQLALRAHQEFNEFKMSSVRVRPEFVDNSIQISSKKGEQRKEKT